MAWAPPPPKQPVPCQNSHQISCKKPKRAEVRVQRAQVISLGNLQIKKPKGRDVHDAQTTVYTEARGCPLSASFFRPITRARRRSLGSPPKQPVLCQNSHQISCKKPKRAEVRVQRASRTLCMGYMIPFVTQPLLEIQSPHTNLFKSC